MMQPIAKHTPDEPTRPVHALLDRFRFSSDDLKDGRIEQALDFKLLLDGTVRRLKGMQYTNAHLERLAQKFGFDQRDLSRTNVAYLLKSIVDSELYIDSIRRAMEGK